jgi:hypothetical protein
MESLIFNNIVINQKVDEIVFSITNSYEKISESQMEEILCGCASVSDDLLADALLGIKKAYPAHYATLLEAFSSIAYFFEDSVNKIVSKFARLAIRKSKKQDLKDNLLNEYNGDLEGVELSNSNGDIAIIFLKDAYHEGGFRYSVFAIDGFRYHRSRKTYSECLDTAIEEGYFTRCENKLNTFSQHPDFFLSKCHC